MRFGLKAASQSKVGLMFFANISLKLTNVCENLVLVPFFISAWGVAFYGEWLTLTAIPSVLALANFGMEVAVANLFVVEYNNREFGNAQRIFNAGFTLLTILILFCFACIFLFFLFLSNFGIFDSILIPKEEALISLTILMCSRLFSFYHEQQNALFLVSRKANVSILLKAIASAIRIILTSIALLSGFGVIAIAIIDLMSTIFISIGLFLKGREYDSSIYRNIRWEFNEFSKVIFNKGMAFFTIRIWMMLYFQGSILVVRFICGPVVVAAFNTVRILTRSGNQAFNIIGQSIFPELQYLITTGSKEKAVKLYLFASTMVVCLAVFVLLFLANLGLPLYEVWTDGKLEVPKGAWNIFIFGLAVNSIWSLSEIVYRSVNKPEWFSISGIIASFVSIGLLFFLAKPLGITGIAITTLVFEVAMALLVLPLSYNLIGVSKVSIENFFYNIRREIRLLLK